jgi:hypothetical protein
MFAVEVVVVVATVTGVVTFLTLTVLTLQTIIGTVTFTSSSHPPMHRLYSLLLTRSTPVMTHTNTDISSIRTMTSSYYDSYLTWWLSKYWY